MRSRVAFCTIIIALLSAVVADNAHAESDRAGWRIGISGSYGLVSTFQADQSGWDMTPQREGGFFEPAISLSLRIGKGSRHESGFRGCVDISFYYFSVPLSTYYADISGRYTVFSHHLGYVRGRWIVVSPGWQRLNLEGNGLSGFLGLAGIGLAINQFTVNPHLSDEMTKVSEQIDLGSSFIVALVPAKAEWIFAGRYSIGLSFSGILLTKPGIDSAPDSESWRRPDGDDLNLSNIHMHAILGVWL
jgi:hypothetical protein